jgi:general nucleoside transport system permease protein
MSDVTESRFPFNRVPALRPPAQGEVPPVGESSDKDYALQRERQQKVIRALTPFFSIIIAILVSSVFIVATGGDPVAAFKALLLGAFGSPRAIGETLLRTTPLIFTGLALAYGFRSGVFNIGAEGQLYMGGLAAAYFGVLFGGLSIYLAIPLVIVFASIAGAAWAFIPALMKVRIGANEVITTMMFTYIGRYVVSWLVTGPLVAPGGIPQTVQLPVSSELPRLSAILPFLGTGRAHLGIVVAIAFAVVLWAVLKYTTLGYEARAVGYNPFASQTGGVSVGATVIKSLCISGALAGIAGAVEVMAVYGRLFDNFSNNFGFTGIAVALLAKNNPLGVIAAALLFGAMDAGAGTMQLEAGVSQKVISIIQAVIIFAIAAETIVTWSIDKFQGRKGVGA